MLVAVSCTTYTVYAIRQEATVVQMATLLSRLNNRHQELTQQLTSAALVVETMKDVDQMKQNLQTGMSAAAHSVDSASWSLGAHINQSAAGACFLGFVWDAFPIVHLSSIFLACLV